MKEKVFFKTFGCRTNIYDTELLKSYVKDYEIINDENQAQIIVVNSCTVTNGADSGIKSYINSMQKKGIKIILTGCGAVSKGKELFNAKQVFGVLGASNKDKINQFLSFKTSFYELGNLNFIDKDIVSEYKNHTKAFVKIQEGCDFACSYCIIPSVRGKSRSVDEKVLLKQVEILASNGYSEIVLTGTNIGSYGLKNGTSLSKLLQKMGRISGIKRIRLGSLEPAQIDEAFLELLDEAWLERHLHIALQHTSETMLRIMRRRSHTNNDLKLFNIIASKGYALGTDFIVAHPGESEEIWQEALERFKEFPLTHIHAFIFSPRDNTYSATMKNTINGALAKERLNILTSIIKDNNYKFRQNHKIPLEILIENKKEGFFEGYDQFFNKIKIKSNEDIAKEWITLSQYEVQEKFNFANLKASNEK
ncbi:tRNA (N(6)-L-threonylcarbamoyladenosine(37)-C(2))-methylthiotransferase MtaB [Campylobacter sp. VicNov18]|uniref:tRNA (N(6)-L-threonylcarbamoyladenosine(37)-C(2))- methylthiotransferase MtaB n=1 Tax=Campylobacter bilis TaxID=2691918 RepID=UPI00130D8630|nr:tRNA (N(6)-L-threonylcarbamoyladenosine(37)-C(2))-methylthiotransferase MtaB [Campylobacter bilis]MPV63834.1 tRNA (N(6)-L-threonylcarbamoyladenosine(37)-C(2))-methylthiotransferase MtaB [Campylobacter hepaticus]MBM0637335.1 tRNA (N(6)-L-threonylcarbamoyladenosine(37)-C(2))-methylthiotransferase MtaB [Campylobacter bilis]MCC8278054.1 tRNA (N(6)-L-threonylcarbamoyladenosine(37)-C(2))-methylthiotransferase MtaB [Campylobacter bilis]MCC8299558.1 tRNA (N(6)-L-threonylcarbamoyladenosine(37)-C(2))-